MDQATFLAILSDIVTGFEDPDFKRQMAVAKAASDVPTLMSLPMSIQANAFAKHGLDAANGTVSFKQAGKLYGAELEVAPLIARMRAALA